jgi:hypothetical protein
VAKQTEVTGEGAHLLYGINSVTATATIRPDSEHVTAEAAALPQKNAAGRVATAARLAAHGIGADRLLAGASETSLRWRTTHWKRAARRTGGSI